MSYAACMAEYIVKPARRHMALERKYRGTGSKFISKMVPPTADPIVEGEKDCTL